MTGTTDDIVRLPAIADLTFSASLKAALVRAQAAGADMVVDASAVQRISTPCLQILVAASRDTLRLAGPKLVLRDPSANFIETVAMLALEEAFGLTRT